MGVPSATFALSTRRQPVHDGVTRLLRGMRRWRTLSLGMLIVLTFLGVAALAPVLAPFDPAKPDYQALREAPSARHLFGTDDKGRDIFSRVLTGSRISLN